MRLEMEGIDRLRNIIRTRPDIAVRALAEGLYTEANLIMTRSKADFVPVDLGTLRGSGHVQDPETDRTKVTVTMGYGGAASAYALVQHERTDYHHTVGQAKYLEQPVLEAAGGLGNRIGRRVGKRLET